jgi:chorismate mutase
MPVTPAVPGTHAITAASADTLSSPDALSAPDTPPAPHTPPAPETPSPSTAPKAVHEAPEAAADRTGAHTPQAAEVITDARGRIDALDERIIGLVKERMAVSARIQESRIASGGRRVNLSREMEILGHYRDSLGKPGTTLAMTLLELCRGRI